MLGFLRDSQGALQTQGHSLFVELSVFFYFLFFAHFQFKCVVSEDTITCSFTYTKLAKDSRRSQSYYHCDFGPLWVNILNLQEIWRKRCFHRYRGVPPHLVGVGGSCLYWWADKENLSCDFLLHFVFFCVIVAGDLLKWTKTKETSILCPTFIP